MDNRMEIDVLVREIGLDPGAAAEVMEQIDDTAAEVTGRIDDMDRRAKDAVLTGLFREDEQAFFAALRSRPAWKQDALRIYLLLACESYEMYRQRGISDRIYFDTMADIAIWERECMRKYGVHGLEEIEWIARHLRLDLFCLGSLQFEPILLKEDISVSRDPRDPSAAGELRWEAGSLALNVHIPDGADLSGEACLDSFRQAYEFFGNGAYLFICDSWLLAPELRKLLPSNILRFQDLFDIIRVHYTFPQAEQRIFTDVLEDKSRYPQDTTLRRSAREYFMGGGDPGIGVGVIPMIRCMPFMSELKCVMCGITAGEYARDPEVMAETELTVYERFKPDRIVTGPNTRGIAESLGAEFIYPEQGTPYADKPALSGIEDIYKLKAVTRTVGKTPEAFDIYRKAVGIIKKRLPWWTRVEMSIGGPFTIASMLLGAEKLLRECRKHPAAVHHLLRVITDTQKTCIEIAADSGCGVAMADPVANPELIGPGMYEEFVLPYTMELTEYSVVAAGRKVSLHMCGSTYSIWKYLAKYPLAELSLDNCIDFGRAAEELGPHVRIAGNVDPVGIMLGGTREELSEAVRRCIASGSKALNGFTLATGCDVPENADPVHIDWLMEEVRKQALKEISDERRPDQS